MNRPANRANRRQSEASSILHREIRCRSLPIVPRPTPSRRNFRAGDHRHPAGACALASLKLTVALFALSIFLVLAGTLAQVEMDIWQVIHHYFRCGLTWIPFRILIPKSFVPLHSETAPENALAALFAWMRTIAEKMGSFPYPRRLDPRNGARNQPGRGAHAVRFTVRSADSGSSRGCSRMAAGVLTTWLVIQSGSNKDGVVGHVDDVGRAVGAVPGVARAAVPGHGAGRHPGRLEAAARPLAAAGGRPGRRGRPRVLPVPGKGFAARRLVDAHPVAIASRAPGRLVLLAGCWLVFASGPASCCCTPASR